MSTDGEPKTEGQAQPKTLTDFVKVNPAAQDELNTMMASNRKKLTQQNTELVTQLEQIKQNANLTADERDELQTRITQLEEQYMSKEELTKRETTKKEREFQKSLEGVTKDRDSWKGRYSTATVERSLQDAAVAAEAVQSAQIVDILRGRTQISEAIVDGKPTGEYIPVVKFNDTNEEGQSVVLDLTPAEAVKRMKELPNMYGNLFKGTAAGGLGEGSSAEGGAAKTEVLEDITKDPVKYAKWRKDNPDLDISKLRRAK